MFSKFQTKNRLQPKPPTFSRNRNLPALAVSGLINQKHQQNAGDCFIPRGRPRGYGRRHPARHGAFRHHIGGTVVIIGPGPIGLIAMQLARLLGAAQIIAVGRGADFKRQPNWVLMRQLVSKSRIRWQKSEI